ncbi:MAG: nucleotidyltransferase family protein [Candidatus Omnitrophota bacterium]
MKVILLCAGYATRLYPLTKDKPKPLLPVGGRPILEWTLDRLVRVQGVERVFVVTNERFSGHFEAWNPSSRYPWPIETVNDHTTSNEDRLGAIGDLRYTLVEKGVASEDLLVIAGDNFFDFDLKEFVDFASAKRPHPVIAVYDVADKELAKNYGLVRTDASGKILEFYEKPENPPTTLASCGLYWLPGETRVLLDRYLAEGHNCDQPGHYMRWLAEADKLFAIPLRGRWLDIGDPVSYDKANRLYQEFPRHGKS